MRIVVSVGGRFHAIELASELDRLGYLERLITTKSWYWKGKISPSRCKAILVPEILGSLVRRIGPLRQKGMYSYVKDNLFDALARRYIPPCEIFHAWGNFALASIPRARSFGARIVIERGSTHPRFQDEILREECERYGVQVERAHPQIIEKGLREIEEADAVIIPSEFVRRSFLRHGIPESKLRMIPYGIDLRAFTTGGKKEKPFRVLFVGNIGIQKGIHYLLEAWKQSGLSDAELWLVGRVEPGMEGILSRYEGLFVHHGYIPHDELYRTYGKASVFALPSLQEGSALVTYEAMACGLPCIVSENTGSIIRDGQDGWIIPVRDVDAIRERILWMYEHREEAARMGESALRHVQNFTWERYARGVIEVYRSILGRESAE